MEAVDCSWDSLVEIALHKLDSLKLLRSLRPIQLAFIHHPEHDLSSTLTQSSDFKGDQLQVFDKMQLFDRTSVEVYVAQPTFNNWLHDIPSSGTLPFLPLEWSF